MLINEVKARKILDSRKEQTIEVEIAGCKASAPSGKSKGKYETLPFYKSLEWNINFINSTSFSSLDISSFSDLKKLEHFIKNKVKLKDAKQFGANALFALECVILKALAKSEGLQLWQIINKNAKKLPIPLGNVIEGGLHVHNKIHPTFQEFLLIPNKKTFKENYQIIKKIHSEIPRKIKTLGKSDEGAWQVSLNDEQVLEFLSKFKEVGIGIDAAASSFYCNNSYCYANKCLSSQMQIHFINALIKKFNLFYIEDPLQEEDFKGFSKIFRSTNNFIVGDDLTATHITRVKKAIRNKSINALIIKPNQNGSLLELAEIFKLCKENKIKTILSHRSGETIDNALADLAFGFGADFIKCGISTKWREVKLARLKGIEKNLKK